MNVHRYVDWNSISYLTSHLTHWPKVREKEKPVEKRRCGGVLCTPYNLKHVMSKMYWGFQPSGSKIWICESCQKIYTGDVVLEKVK